MLKHEKQEITEETKSLIKKAVDELRREFEKKLSALQKQVEKPEKPAKK